MSAVRYFSFCVALFLSPAPVFAGEAQFFAGANSTTYGDAPDANTWGVSLRAQYNFSNAGSGWIASLYAPGLGLMSSELGLGYVWKSQGELYFEGGLGAAYSRIWGPSPLLVAGAGYRVSPAVFFDFPVIFTSSLIFMPSIGIAF